jgi:hypothetical protein
MNPARVAASKFARALQLMIMAAVAWTAEASADTYVVLSLVGDHLTIVQQEALTGTHLDRNRYQTLALPDSAFDDFAVRTATATIAKARPGAGVVSLRAAGAKLPDATLDADSREVKALIASIASQLPPLSDAHLLLMAPRRAEPELKVVHGTSQGHGKFSGLGFYIDETTRIRDVNTGEVNQGFLGAFAHFQLVLINLQTNAFEAHESVVEGWTYPLTRSEDRTPWNALTPSQKTKAIELLLKRGIEDKLPGMLGAAKQ